MQQSVGFLQGSVPSEVVITIFKAGPTWKPSTGSKWTNRVVWVWVFWVRVFQAIGGVVWVIKFWGHHQHWRSWSRQQPQQLWKLQQLRLISLCYSMYTWEGWLFPFSFDFVHTKVAPPLSLMSLSILSVFLLHTKWCHISVS